MKLTYIKFLIIIISLFLYSCKAQTTTDYINFYNDVVPKLNTIVPNKAQFYGQNFSNFSNELQNKGINIKMLNYDYKTDFDTQYYVLRLYFNDNASWNIATNNSYQFPSISIVFQNAIPKQIESIVQQYHGQWNSIFEQFFANMKIQEIIFMDVNGYNSTDNSIK